MKHHYSPHTGEHIVTDDPADWMGETDLAPPPYNAAVAGCFWRGTSWEVVQSAPAPGPSVAEQIRALEAPYADAQAKLNRQVALAVILNTACSAPEASGMTRAEVHDFLMATQPDSAYAVMYTLEQQVAALRAQQ